MKLSRAFIIAAGLAVGLPVAGALANYAYKDGNGALQTVFSFVCQTSNICPAQVLVDSTGTEKGTPSNPVRIDPTGTTQQPVQVKPGSADTISGAGTNPTSTLTLPSATAAYTANQMIANNATGTSVTVPSFVIANSAGAAAIERLRLYTNDTTSTAWGGQTIQVDLWSAAPTFASGNGDRGAFLPATGTAAHLASYSCVMSPEYGDGAYGECSESVGSFSMTKLASGTSIFWTLKAVSGSGTTGNAGQFTLVAEVLN